MFKRITCPACNHSTSVPEATMGKRITCNNCQSPFVAGASVAVAQNVQSPPEAAFNKTMIGEEGPPINYNCPRCKTALQASAFEAGKKKPCPSCGQRLQVPAAQAAAAAAPAAGLNKTMLTDGSPIRPPAPPIQYECPRCKKPLESPASEALTKKPCPGCGGRLQVPAASTAGGGINKTILASDRNSSPGAQPSYGMSHASGLGTASNQTSHGGGQTSMTGLWEQHFAGRPLRIGGLIAAALVIFFLVVPAVIRGGRTEDMEARLKAEQALEQLKADIKQKQMLFEQEQKEKQKWDLMMAQIKAQEDKLKKQTEIDRQNLILQSNEKLRQEKEAQRAAKKAELDLEKQKFEAMINKMEAKTNELQSQLKNAKQQTQTIIQQPAPVYYHPPYDWRYYRWWHP